MLDRTDLSNRTANFLERATLVAWRVALIRNATARVGLRCYYRISIHASVDCTFVNRRRNFAECAIDGECIFANDLIAYSNIYPGQPPTDSRAYIPYLAQLSV